MRRTQIENNKENRMKVSAIRTSEDARELGLYVNDCCEQELIFDKGDTFWRCPRCHHLCSWVLESKITRDADLERLAA
jgi:hypothetical protein